MTTDIVETAGYWTSAEQCQAASQLSEKRLRDGLRWCLGMIVHEPYEWSCEEDVDAHRDAIEALSTTPSSEALDEYVRDRLGEKQAEIDRLMLEFCPEEMTDEQKAEWAKHQVPTEFKAVCPRCKVDRFKEPCPYNSLNCPMGGTAQAMKEKP